MLGASGWGLGPAFPIYYCALCILLCSFSSKINQWTKAFQDWFSEKATLIMQNADEIRRTIGEIRRTIEGKCGRN